MVLKNNKNFSSQRHVLPAEENKLEATHEELARLAGSISKKLVTTPEKSQVLLCMTNAMSSFIRRVRWYYYHYNIKHTNSNISLQINQNDTTSQSTSPNATLPPLEDLPPENSGLNSNQKLPALNPPLASTKIENFLRQTSVEILSNIREHPVKGSEDDLKASSILARLKVMKNEILLATDKTNKFIAITTSKYEELMKNQLSLNAIPAERSEISNAIENLRDYINTNSSYFSKKETDFIIKGISTYGVPEVFGIYKDHKPIPDLRLIVPACSSFIFSFKKVLTKGMENLFSSNGVVFSKVIVNSYDLKDKLSEMNLVGSENSIFSLDVTQMYPSIGTDLIEQAMLWYATKFNFSLSDLNKLIFILKSFREVSNYNFIRFQENFYSYVGKDPDNPGLSMGDIESALFADAVINYIYHKLGEEGVFDNFKFYQSYRDDGIIISNSKMTQLDILNWKTERFDPALEILTNGKIKFTIDYYSPESGLNYLDLNMKYSNNGKLKFSVYTKTSTKLNYLNSGSLHHPKQIHSVAPAVIKRLARLSSYEGDETFKLNERFPQYSEALCKAGLISQDEAKMERPFKDYTTVSKTNSKWDSRKIPFVMEYCKPWLKEPVHAIIKRNLKVNHLTSFIRFSMVYRKFSNFAEKIKADMRGKINSDVEDLNYQNRDCNCHGGICQLTDKNCRKSAVTYEITCDINNCGKLYIGSTQNFAKERIGAHMGDIRKVLKGEELLRKEGKDWLGKCALDTFTKHLLSHDRSWLPQDRLPSRKDIREVTSAKVIQYCGAFMLGTEKCTICKWEKFWIWSKRNNMNARTELFSRCPHKPKLMRPAIKTTSH